MTPIMPRKRAFYFIFFVLVFFVAIPFLVLYSMGYSFSSWSSLTSRGGMYVFVGESGSDIYIDQKLEKTTGTFQKELFLQTLKPGRYMVLVANQKFWPWAKYVDVKEKQVSTLFPFLVPRDTSVEQIASTSVAVIAPLFDQLQATSTATSTRVDVGILKRNMKIWSDGDTVFARWLGNVERTPAYFCNNDTCQDVIVLFTAPKRIKHIDFYPGRDDAIIMSVGNGIFATEIDIRPYQNMYPLYRGKQPDFRIDGSTIYIKDEDFIAQLVEL